MSAGKFSKDKLPEGELKRLSTPMTAAEITAVDEWGFARRIRNRSDAVRLLVQAGIEASAAQLA